LKKISNRSDRKNKKEDKSMRLVFICRFIGPFIAMKKGPEGCITLRDFENFLQEHQSLVQGQQE